MRKLQNSPIDEQSLRFLESLVDPALITSADHSVSIANLALETLLGSESHQFEDLFTSTDRQKLGDLRTWTSRHDAPTSISLKSQPERPLSVSIQKAHFLPGEFYLLIFRNERTVIAESPEQHEAQQSDEEQLEVRVLKQTAKLAAESSRRAAAEQRARLEAESKINLFSDAVHHLNNPLNQVVGAYELVSREMVELRSYISDLLSTEPLDPQAEEIRKLLDSQFETALTNLLAVHEASGRMTDTIEFLRIVSGIDGWSFLPTTISAICDIGLKRSTGLLYDKLIKLKESWGDLRVVGHPVLYTQAINLIERGILQHGFRSKKFQLKTLSEGYELVWDSIETSPDLPHLGTSKHSKSLTQLSELEYVGKQVEFLLTPYESKVAFYDESVGLRLRNREAT